MLPLIDVVFLLLVFFIYAMLSMVVHHGLKLDLPSATATDRNVDEHLTISIDAENRLFINEAPVTLDALPARISALRKSADQPVFIDGDQSADLGVAIQLLDHLKQSGIENVSFSCKTPAP